MDSEERSQLQKQSQILRGELKKWEKEFSAANEGRKATRDEIKQNPSIAQKYKDYNKTRDTLAGKPPKPEKSSSVAPSSPKSHKNLKRKAPEDDDKPVQTPSKRHHQTPRNHNPKLDFFDQYDSPSIIRNLFTPTKKQWISPTPQKNGIPYGLFDLMDEEDTPHKDNGESKGGVVHATPSRKTSGKNWEDLSVATAGRRNYSQTPTTRRVISLTTPIQNPGNAPDTARTPSSSISKLHFPTPSFLRRDSRRFSTALNDSSALSPPIARGPRKPFGRGLSSILANLRKMNDEAEDEDLEALREVEGNKLGDTKPGNGAKPKPVSKSRKPDALVEKSGNELEEPEIQVEDSQIPNLLSGFDDESKFDSDPETTNRDGAEKPRVGKQGYKKKRTQKRTTRKANIRPTRAGKAIPHDVGKGVAFESDEDELALDTIPETQLDDDGDYGDNGDVVPDIDEDTGIVPFDSENLDDYYGDVPDEDDEDSGSDYTASSGGTRYRKEDQSEHEARVQARKLRRAQLTGVEDVGVGGDGEEKKGVRSNVRKGVRKVTAVAAQNFRRLKLRNKGAKGGGGGGRFGRRR